MRRMPSLRRRRAGRSRELRLGLPGRGAAWLARWSGGPKVASSNLAAPTGIAGPPLPDSQLLVSLGGLSSAAGRSVNARMFLPAEAVAALIGAGVGWLLGG